MTAMNDCPYDVFLPEAPENFAQAILEGRVLIRRYEARRRKLRSCALFAAGALAVVGLAFAGMGALRHPAEDSIAAKAPAAPAIELTSAETQIVLCHPEDAYYHIFGAYCEQSRGDEVELPLETAMDFGKLPCSACYPESK